VRDPHTLTWKSTMSAVMTCTLLRSRSRARLMMNSRWVLLLLTAVMVLFLYA
jgi:fumarate reductase subunit C